MGVCKYWGHGLKGIGMGVCVWTMCEGAVEMGICECLGPGVKGFRGWVSVSIGAMSEGLRGECLQVSRARG